MAEFGYDSEEWLHIDDLHQAQDHLIGLFEIIYQDKSIDDFEFHLEEIANQLDMTLPEGEIKIKKKE